MYAHQSSSVVFDRRLVSRLWRKARAGRTLGQAWSSAAIVVAAITATPVGACGFDTSPTYDRSNTNTEPGFTDGGAHNEARGFAGSGGDASKLLRLVQADSGMHDAKVALEPARHDGGSLPRDEDAGRLTAADAGTASADAGHPTTPPSHDASVPGSDAGQRMQWCLADVGSYVCRLGPCGLQLACPHYACPSGCQDTPCWCP